MLLHQSTETPSAMLGRRLRAPSDRGRSSPAVIMLLAKAFQRDVRPIQEADTLGELGYTLHVIAWDREARFARLENLGGVWVRSFHHMNLASFSKLRLALGAVMFQFLLFLETVRLIRRLKLRPVVHAHDFNTLVPACILRILRLSSSLVYDCHELTFAVYSEWFNPLIGAVARLTEERCVPVADAVITVSDPIAGYLSRFNPNTETISNCMRRRDVPSASRRELRRQLHLPAEVFIVSYVGEIRYGCRLDLLLSAASRVRGEKVHFLVVGGGPLAQEFGQVAQQEPNIPLTIKPQVRHGEALRYVAASDLTWVIYQNLPASLSERLAIPWKFSESLACGVPVIVGRDTLCAELVERFACGFVLRDDSTNAVVGEIVALARDQRAHDNMSVAARNAATSLGLYWEIMSDRLRLIYATLPGTAGAEKLPHASHDTIRVARSRQDVSDSLRNDGSSGATTN